MATTSDQSTSRELDGNETGIKIHLFAYNGIFENLIHLVYAQQMLSPTAVREWKNMSDCARRNLEPGERTEAQPEDEKYTLAGLKDLKRFVRYATDALHIKSWHNGDYNRSEHMEPGGGGVGPGFGDGGGELLWDELEPLTAAGLSICYAYTRWIRSERTEAQTEDEKYTLAGLKDLKRFIRYATDALHIKSWYNGDYNRLEHMEPGGGGVGPGFGDGEGRY
nr:hypothetical protein [Tanacetum cinerariifolium]